MFESGEARPFDLVPVAHLALPISKMHPSSTAERLALRIGNVGQNGQNRHIATTKQIPGQKEWHDRPEPEAHR